MATMVIGGNGYAGSNVLRQLVHKGEMPICYDIAPPSRLWADMTDKVQMVQADVLQKYELLYIKDARDLVYRLLLADTLKHRIYNAANEAMCSLQEVAGWLRSLLPAAEIEFDESVEFPEGYDFAMPCGSHLDITRAKKELGYIPPYKPPEALKDYLHYLGHKA